MRSLCSSVLASGRVRALFFARDETSRLGSTSIDTEHLLLGLIREGKGLIGRLFADAGIGFDEIRDEVLRRVSAQPKTSTSAEIPFSAAAERVLQHSAWEADRLLHDCVGTEHLLLGLLRKQDSVAADVLTSRGLRLDRVREQIVELLSDGERWAHPGPPGIPANTFKWPWLRFVASRSLHSSSRAWLTGTRMPLPGCKMKVGFCKSWARATGEIDSRNARTFGSRSSPTSSRRFACSRGPRRLAGQSTIAPSS